MIYRCILQYILIAAFGLLLSTYAPLKIILQSITHMVMLFLKIMLKIQEHIFEGR